MPALLVSKSPPLSGEVTIHGAKNSVLPILAATLLCRTPCVLHNCPDILDVTHTRAILHSLGCASERRGASVYIDPRSCAGHSIPPELATSMRASSLFLGALLARQGEASLSLPDGIIIQVRESVVSFAVMTDTNACWLVGPSGKALERIEPAAFNENPHINGLLISTPTEGEAVSSPTPTALAAALDVMKELDGTGLLEHIRVIDVEKEYDMSIWYDERYEIKLGGTDELAYKIRYLCSILDQLSEFQAGTIDLTQAAQKRATFQPAA